MSDVADKLLDLAVRKFPSPTETEKKLLRAAVGGDAAMCGGQNEEENAPEHAQDWGHERTIRAELLRWLCADQRASSYVHPKGIQLWYAKVVDKLDLTLARVPFPIILKKCAIPDGVSLTGAETRLLDFGGSRTGPFMGDGLVVYGNLSLDDGFQVMGEARLIGASIRGNLNCSHGRFLNPGGNALIANRLTVNGNVFFRDCFYSAGVVRLIGASIRGDLDCGGGHFHSICGGAIIADGVKVDGHAFFNKCFQAEGEVDLVGATITGALQCSSGRFLNPGGNALIADGIKISRHAFFNKGFQAVGEVWLTGATIIGDFNCLQGHFRNPGKRALTAGAVKIGGNAVFGKKFKAEGEVNLAGASITGNLICTGCFHNPSGAALIANGSKVGGDVMFGKKFEATGRLGLRGTIITGTLDCHQGNFHNTTLSLIDAKVYRLLDDERSWPAEGNLHLDGLIYTALPAHDIHTRLRWLERQPSKQFRSQPYQQLVKVLREHGRDGDAKRVLIEKEKARGKLGNLGWAARCWNKVLGFTMAHGYKPQRLLIGAALFVLIGWGLFDAGKRAGTMIPTKAEAYDMYEKTGQVPAFYPTFCPFMYSLDTLLPIINFGLKDHWRPRDNGPSSPIFPRPRLASFVGVSSPPSTRHTVATWVTGGLRFARAISRYTLSKATTWWSSGWFLGVYRWIHIGAGWLLITLGIAGITGLVRKD